MLKRLLLTAATGLGIVGLFTITILVLAEYGISVERSGWGEELAVCTLILAVGSSILVFIKVKTKNTIIEDIVINKAKIIKADQEARLNK